VSYTIEIKLKRKVFMRKGCGEVMTIRGESVLDKPIKGTENWSALANIKTNSAIKTDSKNYYYVASSKAGMEPHVVFPNNISNFYILSSEGFVRGLISKEKCKCGKYFTFDVVEFLTLVVTIISHF